MSMDRKISLNIDVTNLIYMDVEIVIFNVICQLKPYEKSV